MPRGRGSSRLAPQDPLHTRPAAPHAAVENLDDCISINHNWVNGHSVHWTWALLRAERAAAAEGIEDCRPLCG